MTATAAQTARIQSGIALLDQQRPGWRSKIDLDALDLGSCHFCILGQVFADTEDAQRLDRTAWGVGMMTLFDSTFDGHRWGFDRDSANAETYESLQQAWVEILALDEEN